MIIYEWEVRGFGVIERCRQPGQLDKLRAVPPSELSEEWRKSIAGYAYRSYAQGKESKP